MRWTPLLPLLLSAAGVLPQAPASQAPPAQAPAAQSPSAPAAPAPSATPVLNPSQAPAGPASSAQNRLDANDLVKAVVHNELELAKKDRTLWSYRQTQAIPAPEKTRIVVQTPDGNVDLLNAVDGHPLSPEQKSLETDRMQRFVGDPSEQKKARNAQAADVKKSVELVTMLPEAFLFDYAGTSGDNVKLNFKPNVNFESHSTEGFVLHKMDGFVIVNAKEKRLVEVYGRLTNKVSFAGGMLGHLDQGGTFDVKREEVGPQYWAITSLKVNMNGRILFFRTIAEHQDETDNDFHRVADDITLTQAVALAQKESATISPNPAEKLADKAAAPSPDKAPTSGQPVSDSKPTPQ